MRTLPGLCLLSSLLGTPRVATAQSAPQPPYRDSRLPTALRVGDLLGRMTLE